MVYPTYESLLTRNSYERDKMDGLTSFMRNELGGYERMWANVGRHRYARHAHDEYSVIVITSGEKIFRAGRQEFKVVPGQVIVVSPGEAHDCEATRNTDWSHRCWYIQPSFVSAITGNPAFRADAGGPSQVIDSPELAASLVRLHNKAASGEPEALLDEFGVLRTALERAYVHSGFQPARAVPNARTRRAELYEETLRDEYTEKLDLARLAEFGGVSKHQVIRDLKSVRGMTPGQFLKDLRLRRGKQLLRDGQSIASVSAHLGFADQSHFTRAFRDAYRITPASFKRLTHENNGP